MTSAAEEFCPAMHTNLAFKLLVVQCFSNLNEMSGNGIGAD